MDRIKRLRWQQRSLPEDIRKNLSPSEIEVWRTSLILLSSHHTRVQGVLQRSGHE